MRGMAGAGAVFDAQAEAYDGRAGLPPGVAEAVARAVVEAVPVRAGEAVLEIGAGTGEIGARLAGQPVRYVGLDLSGGMLGQGRRRFAVEAVPGLLLRADGRARWPARDGAVAAVFSSRAIHWLVPEHAAAEAVRVLGPGGALVLGQVRRAASALRSRLRRRMRDALRARGLRPRDGAERRRRLLALLGAGGAPEPAERLVARWPVAPTAREALGSWAGKPGLAGLDLPPEVKAEVLDEVAGWAAAAFGGLDAPERSEEAYVLEVAWPRGRRG
jgi:SAM-dependent methyltransferase